MGTDLSIHILLQLDREEASLLLRNSTHTGTIRGLDFNLFQTNLLASAGSNSEVGFNGSLTTYALTDIRWVDLHMGSFQT